MSSKRKAGAEKLCKRKKTAANTCTNSAISVRSQKYETPLQFLEFLLTPLSLQAFVKKHWEKEPFVSQNRPIQAEFWSPLFGKDHFFALVKEKQVYFSKDIAVCKYEGGKRTNFERQGRATVAKIKKLFEGDKATLQIHQPQRWVDGLWEVLEKLECFFGCLVGCNVYITPPSAQGLAPHYDDVEVFIVQLEGEKCWRLYKPPVKLPRSYSKDFSIDEIGQPTHEFTLKPGDLLYMPRGTIHQALTPESSGTHSTHITISTYQNHTVGDCLKNLVLDLVDAAQDSCLQLRKGLPMQFLPHSRLAKADVETSLEAVLNYVKSTDSPMPMAEELVHDFMRTRLPPFGVDCQAILETTPDGEAPGLNDRIRFRYPSHVTYVVDGDLSEENDAANKSSYSLAEQPLQQNYGNKLVLLVTSVFNDREKHMVSATEDDEEEDLEIAKFPPHFLDAIKQLCGSNDFVRCGDLSLPSDEDKLLLVTTLWSLYLLDVEASGT
ncbi:ribosomal oxygenase 2-like [Dermacentor andersoni]|uniref:ribosomal oxygenase 2-like n=1 Tax=Dermacentor andersoni TaxID=34620 RepID=UPI0021554BEA|nr:ribosomal oxygenase 2-like [Dermacentor andersoni]